MYDFILKRSQRKTLALEIKKSGEIIVRAPLKLSEKKINSFVEQHSDWIEKNLKKVQERKENHPEPDEKEIEALRQKAKKYLPKRTAYFAEIMGVQYTSLKITSAKTRYGSCSGRNGICYSLYLMQKPVEAIDYVIVHELAHTVHHNHSAQFYALIEKYMPDYKERNRLLKL
ncbi:MAG: M48 family metallopeptidase [Clostridia bacterium]|nr:M48 family metallopeptidase [Clostridia bacterium]